MNRYLLDCTLRDGGYVNDWKFGADGGSEEENETYSLDDY